LSPLLQPIKNIFFSPKKAAPATPMAQAAADAAADGGGSDDDDDASVSTMDSVDARALDDLEVSCRGYNGLLVLYFF
jgi:hypothetical protein